MEIDNMPGCCTSAILYSFGEHGEFSLMSVENVLKMIAPKLKPKRDLAGKLIENGKLCIFALSTDKRNIEILEMAGFKEVDRYHGVQGIVHILTLHV